MRRSVEQQRTTRQVLTHVWAKEQATTGQTTPWMRLARRVRCACLQYSPLRPFRPLLHVLQFMAFQALWAPLVMPMRLVLGLVLARGRNSRGAARIPAWRAAVGDLSGSAVRARVEPMEHTEGTIAEATRSLHPAGVSALEPAPNGGGVAGTQRAPLLRARVREGRAVNVRARDPPRWGFRHMGTHATGPWTPTWDVAAEVDGRHAQSGCSQWLSSVRPLEVCWRELIGSVFWPFGAIHRSIESGTGYLGCSRR
jgi:hypothetical protein